MSNNQQDIEQPSAEVEQENVETVEAVEGEVVDAEVAGDEQLDAAQQRIAELEAALLASQAKAEEHKDTALRAKAESENIRRRASQDVEKAHKFALEKFISELLPVIDNMERALAAGDKDNEVVAPLMEGVELTLKSFLAVTEKFELAVIDPVEQAFDPEKHQAIGMQESADVKPNHVMAVLQKGYELNGRVVRPAMVMVAKAASVDTQA